MKQTGIEIIKRLRQAGYKAVFAGGCVRDLVMSNEPHDWDIATSAKPGEVEKLFNKTLAIGKLFGVIVVIENGMQFEVATFRSDADYDGRRPGKVEFCTMEQDALRRDITINGMFYDPIDNQVIDFVNGLQDIEDKIIRFIGNPEDRIQEDHLRMMRAIRFADRLQFVIEEESFDAIKRNSYKIQYISKERIREEFIKVFTKSRGGFFNYLLLESMLAEFIIPEIRLMIGSKQDYSYHPEGDVYNHTELILNKLQDDDVDYRVKLAGLFHDIGKPLTFKIVDNEDFPMDWKITNHGHAEIGAEMTELILRRLTFSNDEIDYICALVKDHMKFYDIKKMKKSTFRKLAGQPYFQDLLKLHYADCMASNVDLTNYNIAIEKYDIIKNEPILPKPLVDGRDLITIGFTEGKEIGEVKSHIYDLQLEGLINSIDDGLIIAKELYKERYGSPI